MKSVLFGRSLAALPLLALSLTACAGQVEVPRSASEAPAEPATATAPSASTGWGFPVYDIPADPAVRYGVLPNGMKYAILHNETPRNTAAIRFGFDVGWVDEMQDELGLAHFIEHMAFNGSTNVPEGEMIKLLEREGLAFGADTNASTGFEETIYKLDLPRNDPALMGTALMLMRETASELTIAPEAVDRERGVIQSETRTRNNFNIRKIKDYLRFVAPGTRFFTRFRADGTEQVIDTAKAQTLRDLYARYYRPDNATLVVVGDFDPAAVEAQIRTRFTDWRAPSEVIEHVDQGTIDLTRGAAADTFVDPDVEYSVTIDRFAPYKKRFSTVADFREELLSALGTSILNRRLQKIAIAADAPIISGAASAGDFFELADQASMSLQAKEGEWREALAVGEQAWRRAVLHGFTQAELAEQLANFELRYRTAAEQEATRRSNALADNILGTVDQKRIFVTPQARFELFERLKPELTVEAVEAMFREQFTMGPPLIHVTSKVPVEGGEEAILAVYNASRQVAVDAPAEGEAASFGYTDFGTASAIASDTRIEDLGIRTIRFTNNVRLNLKPTEFEDGKLRFAIRLGSGQLAVRAENLADALFLSTMSGAAGTGKHGFDELQQILAGRDVTYGFTVGEDQSQISGATTMADLPLQMQLSAAYLSDPGYRAEALTRWRALIPPFLAQTDSTPQAVAQFEVPQIVANGDPRFGLPEQAELEAVALDDVRATMADQLSQAPIEIAVVGDFDEAAVIQAVASTFGALPPRAAELPALAEARQARFAADTAPVTLYHAGAPDQALVQVYWPTDDDDDAQEEATMQLLSEVVQLQLLEEIREKLGASYSPGANSSMSSTYDEFGTFAASVVVAPGQGDAVFAAIDGITADMRASPVPDDLLERARKPLLERIALNRRENGYWLSVAGEAQLRADRLDRVRSYEDRIRKVTPAMLQAAAKRYLGGERALRIRILHESLKP